ncbi:MAG: DUF1461 domain-containing protein [Ruminococcaceae bacterium]|nr:DUF1461 domain-containing protein [Oscillospiraceae bacterium]
MKITDRLSVMIFTCCVILLSVFIPMTSMVTNNDFYTERLADTELYPERGEYSEVYNIGGGSNKCAKLSQEQFDIIIEHITSYLSYMTEDFSLTLDNVLLNGKITNDVSIFGEDAVTHMADVRPLFRQCDILEKVCIVLAVLCLTYMIIRREHIQKTIFSSALAPVLLLVGAATLFVVITAILHQFSDRADYFGTLWEYMHMIFFPFSPDKVNGSLFNDALTSILSLDFFLGVVTELVLYLVIITSLWLIVAFFISKKAKQKTLQN